MCLYVIWTIPNVVVVVGLFMDFLIDGQISSFCTGHHGGWLLTLIMLHKLTQSLQNFKKIIF